MIKIKFLLYVTSLACLLAGCRGEQDTRMIKNIIIQEGNVYYYINGLEKPFNVLFLADTHFTIEDERGREYCAYTRRMGGSAVEPENYGKGNGRDRAFCASLDKAKKEDAELVILGGDIINFPSLASVEYIDSLLDKSGLEWMYIAGNHDWHYEGEPGEAFLQRDKWTHTHLKDLYQGDNPMCYSRVIHGINFIMIDNSAFEITEEQLDFFKKQIGRGLPVILSIHVPIYLPGHNIDYGCGHPDWNEENDIYYKIEQREPWPKNGFTEITYQFRNLVLNSPEVIGIYAGHTHEEAIDFFNDKLQYVVDANYRNKDVLMHFIPVN